MHSPTRRDALIRFAGVAALSAAGAACSTMKPESPAARDRFVTYDSFKSGQVAARKVVVWLPADYDAGTDRYAVLYMHDGQNLFDPATSMAGQPWAVDKQLAALMREGKARKTIVVGINNSPDRSFEFAPAAALATLPPALRDVVHVTQKAPLSDQYLEFVVRELKPFIDANFRTRSDHGNTFVMGSSMGGLISLYALAKYPDVFSAAGCVSTHWPITTNPKLLSPSVDPRVSDIAQCYFDWLANNLPRAGAHRIYFDHGTINLDALYAPFQAKADALMRSKGYRQDFDWMTRVYEGADHNEPAWRARVATPLTFLLRS